MLPYEIQHARAAARKRYAPDVYASQTKRLVCHLRESEATVGIEAGFRQLLAKCARDLAWEHGLLLCAAYADVVEPDGETPV